MPPRFPAAKMERLDVPPSAQGRKVHTLTFSVLDLDNNYITVTHCRLAEPYIE